MKFALQTISIIILGYLCNYFYPFWSLAILAFAAGAIFNLKGLMAFLSGFLAIFLLWGTMAFIIDSETSSNLTNKVAPLFSANNYKLIIIVALIGGLVGGLSAASGTLFRNLFKGKDSNVYKP